MDSKQPHMAQDQVISENKKHMFSFLEIENLNDIKLVCEISNSIIFFNKRYNCALLF